MTYEEFKIQLDISDPCEVLKSVGRQYGTKWFIVCDNGDCHLFTRNGHEIDIKQLDAIKDYAFCGCSSLKRIKIPNSVKHIGEGVFAYCTSLESVEISDSVKCIGEGAFAYCYSLKSINIPSSVRSIGECAFAKCESLKSIVIPISVQRIGPRAFVDCTSLRELAFKGQTLEQVKAMKYYPWDFNDELIAVC